MLLDVLTFMISRWILLRNVLDKCCRENRNTHFIFNIFFFENLAVYEIVAKCDGDRGATNDVTIWRIRVACCISEATCTNAHAHALSAARAHTHKYVIFIAFPRHSDSRTRLILTLYIHCLSCWLWYGNMFRGRNSVRCWRYDSCFIPRRSRGLRLLGRIVNPRRCGWCVPSKRRESVVQLPSRKSPEALNPLLDYVCAAGGTRLGMFVRFFSAPVSGQSFGWHAHQQSFAWLRKRHYAVFVTHEKRDAGTWDCQKYPLC